MPVSRSNQPKNKRIKENQEGRYGLELLIIITRFSALPSGMLQ